MKRAGTPVIKATRGGVLSTKPAPAFPALSGGRLGQEARSAENAFAPAQGRACPPSLALRASPLRRTISTLALVLLDPKMSCNCGPLVDMEGEVADSIGHLRPK